MSLSRTTVDDNELDQLLNAEMDPDSSVSPAARSAFESRTATATARGRRRSISHGSIDALASSESEGEDFLEQLEADVVMYSTTDHGINTNDIRRAAINSNPEDNDDAFSLSLIHI